MTRHNGHTNITRRVHKSYDKFREKRKKHMAKKLLRVCGRLESPCIYEQDFIQHSDKLCKLLLGPIQAYFTSAERKAIYNMPKTRRLSSVLCEIVLRGSGYPMHSFPVSDGDGLAYTLT